MSDIFVSYTRADRHLARRVRNALSSLGVSVLWDESMPAVDWQEYLENSINNIVAVVVIWTPQSSSSGSVRDEARLALDTDKLINIVHEVLKPRFPYDRINGLSIDGWVPGTKHGGWARIVSTIDSRLSSAGAITAGAINAALATQLQEVADLRRDQAQAEKDVARRTQAIAQAERNVTMAAAQLAVSEAQLNNLKGIATTKTVMAAAWADRDEAKAELARHELSLSQLQGELSIAEDRANEVRAKLNDYLNAIGASPDAEATELAAELNAADDDTGDVAADDRGAGFAQKRPETIVAPPLDAEITPAIDTPVNGAVAVDGASAPDTDADIESTKAEEPGVTPDVAENLDRATDAMPPREQDPPTVTTPVPPAEPVASPLGFASLDQRPANALPPVEGIAGATSTNGQVDRPDVGDNRADSGRDDLGGTDPNPPIWRRPIVVVAAIAALLIAAVLVTIVATRNGPATSDTTTATTDDGGSSPIADPSPSPTVNPAGWIVGSWGIGQGADKCADTISIRLSGDNKLVFAGSGSAQDDEQPFTASGDAPATLQTRDYRYRRVGDDKMRVTSLKNDPEMELKKCGP